MDIQGYLNSISDTDLVAKLEEAKKDLVKAANDDPNSEWHEACFAGALIFAEEVKKRGIRTVTVH